MGGRGSGGRLGQWFRWNPKNWPDKGDSSDNANNGTYQEFNDVSRYSKGDRDWSAQFEYDGDGKQQISWFKKYSNSYELIRAMSYDEREAFLRWAEGRFMRGQQYQDFADMDSDRQEWTRIYDKILDKAVMKHGLTVTRDTTAELILGKGKTRATLAELRAMEGKDVFSQGSMSTGVAKTGLGIGSSSDKKVRLRIQIPAGAKGAGMWIGDSSIHGWGARQLEFMTNRESWFRVGKTIFDKKSGMYVVTIKWIGHEKHNYGRRK